MKLSYLIILLFSSLPSNSTSELYGRYFENTSDIVTTTDDGSCTYDVTAFTVDMNCSGLTPGYVVAQVLLMVGLVVFSINCSG